MDGSGTASILFHSNPINVGVGRILERVDDYSIFCHYLGKDVGFGTKISSPLRDDDHPSFWLFEQRETSKYKPRNKKITTCYYDPVLPSAGDVFDFVSVLKDTDMDTTLRIIDNDLGFGIWTGKPDPEKTKKVKLYKPVRETKRLGITSCDYTNEFLLYWYKLGISRELLELYKVKQVRVVHVQVTYPDGNTKTKCFYPKGVCAAYCVGDRYQIYTPHQVKEKKFINDMTHNMIFGYLQLPDTGDLLIIDKSMKDTIYCKSIGYNAVAPKGEGIMIPHHLMIKLLRRFKTVAIMLDNDEAGIKSTNRYIERYPSLIPIFLPNDKDKTDLCSRVGPTKSKIIINNTINQALCR